MMGSDIVLLDMTGVTLIADYFVIATVQSERQ
ncbi:MAG: RsfS/YbeB/iojap family protein, partial [Anaerolineae bacterium]|nr:RsfS/YbeB/iojap family protein [Anaerolineae bacterium]